ncbi:probable E3 ubiquitin-protein ligase MGRN1 isoform X5 [Penaeus japonicus]|uniref:probable E3 ubiquitin-protein ligase MGRN1 isoform X5 n=1 Tax=Penaeus japonicus TaxID=27405 RepID=UPI001C715460|nr:probable E3 ubiquitin-protein ligase MGRN1 isoform X5 [Penaeus japonicus]
MGAITSRQNAGVEEVDIGVNHAYRYPPKSGNYFSSYFIMGGERFDTAVPEMYLFGENMDVNFLGSRPAPFPYPAPTANEPSKTLKALLNIRKESLRFVRAPDDSAMLKEAEDRTVTSRFNIEFTFDCDVRCAITIMYFCTEEVTSNGIIYTPRDPNMNSETYHYKRGANQQFSQVCHVFDPSLYPEEDLMYSFDREVMPIVIYCLAEEGEDEFSTEPRQSHVTFAVVEKHSEGYVLKPLKQKLFVDGLSYLLQEIYGIENKKADNAKVATEEDAEDNGAECVICMCDLRDTLILPCRHLCLCNCCADSLRYQANNCPICRAPFRALLQIKALQKSTGQVTNPQPNTEIGKLDAPDIAKYQHDSYARLFGCDNVPPGYEAVPLIEALNGPSVAPLQPTAPPAHDLYIQLPQSPADVPADGIVRNEASRCFIESITIRSGTGTLEDSTTQTEQPPNSCETTNNSSVVPEMRMSVLLAQESDDVTSTKMENMVSSPVSSAKKKAGRKHSREKQQFGSKDSVKIVNEIGGPRNKEPVDPAETRSLLDEDKSETDTGIDTSQDPALQQVVPNPEEQTQKELRAPQAEAEVDEEEIGEEEPEMEEENEEGEDNDTENSLSSLPTLAMRCAPNSEVEAEDSISQAPTESPVWTPRKEEVEGGKNLEKEENLRRERASASSESGVPASPNGGFSSLSHQSDSLSLPGTPLSNASVISRSSDASVSSASSTRALLSHPTDGFPSSVV